MDAPLRCTLALDRASIAKAGRRTVHAVIDLAGLARGVDAARPPMSIAFAIDISGSMKGEPLGHVVDSLIKLVSLLDERDRAGLTVFSDDASTVVPTAALTPAHRRVFSERARRMRATNRTNVEAGLRVARASLPPRELHERQVVMLLSDGQPNVGESSADGLRRAAASFRPDVSTTTLGYGAHHHEDLLVAIAHGGGGDYVFIHDPRECESELARAIGAQGEVVAEALALRVSLEERVELVRCYAPTPPRLAGGSAKLALPDLFEGQARVVVLELAVDAPAHGGPLSLGAIELRYRVAGEGDEQTLELPLSVGVTDEAAPVVAPVHAKVLLGRADEARAEARRHADRGNFDSAAALLRGLMAEIEAAPAYSAGDGSALSETFEQLLDEAVAYETRPSAEQYRRYKRAFYGVEAATGGKHAGDRGAKSRRSKALMSSVAGEVPKAVLVIENQVTKERTRVPLRREVTIGRGSHNDVVVPLPSLSRRHTRLVVKGGEVLVVDLHTTNGTYVNAQRVDEPQALEPGDVIQVGDARITLERED